MNARQMRDADTAIAEKDARSLLESAPVGLMLCSGPTVTWVNETLLEMLGIGRQEFPSSLAEAGLNQNLAALLGPEERIFLTSPDGGAQCLRRVTKSLEQPSVMVHFFLDITRETTLEKTLGRLEERLATVDTLDHETGLLNRQAVLAALDKQMTRSRRYGNPLALLRLTLEPPEDARDTSATLWALSRELHAQLRWADEVGRLDEKTLLLILPETSEENASKLAAELQLDRVALAKCAADWAITLGVAAWQKGDDRHKLLSRAGWQPS